MRDLLKDLRVGVNSLLRRPGFVAMAIMTLGLGIGASTSMFSIVYGVVFQPLPFADPDRIVKLEPSGAGEWTSWNGANYLDFVEQATAFEAIAGYRQFGFSISDGELPASYRGASVTSGFFKVLGVEPMLGRALSPEVDRPEEPTVVLSHSVWQSSFAGDSEVLGRTVEINGSPYTVVGIMPPGFSYPDGMALWYLASRRVPDTPFEFATDPEQNRGAEYFSAIARLRKDINHEQAQQESSAIAARLADSYPEVNSQLGLQVRPLSAALVGAVRPALLALFGAVGFVLLIACANVANLMLVRAAGRRREMAVRRALGASTYRLVRQLLTESVLLGAAGGAVGLLIAIVGTEALVSLAASQLPRAGDVGISGAVLAFTVLVAMACGLLFGLAPALQARKEDPAAVLQGEAGRLTAGPARGRLRRVLIIAEISISVVLLVGAGLTIRTLARLGAADPGFSQREALTGRLYIPSTKYAEEEEVRGFYRQALERIRALPGVDSAVGVMSLPVSPGISGNLTFIIEGRSFEPGNEPVAGYQAATEGYFETIGLPLLCGRTFTRQDHQESPPVGILSAAAAERFFPGESPLGKRISFNDDQEDPNFQWMTIVGVVGNTLHYGLDQEPRVEIYQPFDQSPWPFMTLVMTTGGNPELLAAPLRRAVTEIDAEQPVSQIRTLREVLHESLARRRFNMAVMSIFAGLALLMAGVGLYSVLSYAVAQQSREIGIRMALGADRYRIIGQVLAAGARPVLLGLAIGTIGAIACTRMISGLIHGIPSLDPIAFTAGLLVLCTISLVAAAVPAIRASRVDPMVSLHRS
jgi:putative ABC transport system permease protein